MSNTQYPKTRLQKELENYIPHRFENFLLDSVSQTNKSEGSSQITIKTNDALNRNIFFKQKYENQKTLIPIISMEIAALTSICVTNQIQAFQTILFTSISNFEIFHDIPLNSTIKANAIQKSIKGNFYYYQTNLEINDTIVGQGLLSAFFTTDPLINTHTNHQKIKEEKKIKYKHPIKHPDFFFVNSKLSSSKSKVEFLYTYPKTHPLIKGHFPNRPVMMGVLQASSLEDACLAIIQEEKKQGCFKVAGHAALTRLNGEIIALIKHFEVIVSLNEPHIKYNADFVKAKKIAFKQIISPGDQIKITLDPFKIEKIKTPISLPK